MTLPKSFLHREPEFPGVSKLRLLFGLVIGIAFSFLFYAFLYLVRETFRIISVTETHDLWVLTDKEVSFYNLFFAFISVIIAQSICLTFWFDHSGFRSGIPIHRRDSIVNDQRVLNWSFLSWFSKLAVVFGITFGLIFHSGFYTFSLYPDYNYMFILIIIVLFFQTWNTIRLTYKRKSVKWFFLSMVVVSIIAFGLSRINLVNYKTINRNYLRYNIYHNYQLHLPETNCYERLYQIMLIKEIYVVKSKSQQHNSAPVLVMNDEETTLAKLPEKIKTWKEESSGFEIPQLICRLNIDRTIKMDFVNRVKKELSKSGIRRIAYAVIPKHHRYDERYYRDLYFSAMLPKWNASFYDFRQDYIGLANLQNIIKIKQTNSGTCYIDDSPVEKKRIKQTIERLIQRNTDYVIQFRTNSHIDFSDYFFVLSSIKEAVYELRNEFSLRLYSRKWDDLTDERAVEVRKKYPLRIFECTSETKSADLSSAHLTNRKKGNR